MKNKDTNREYGSIIDDNKLFKVEINGGSVAWCPKSHNQSKYKYSGCSGFKQPLGSRSAKSLWRAYRRRLTTFGKKMAAVEKRPRWFITLLFDRKVKQDWRLDECLAVFVRFRKYLCKEFPNCWFFFVMEWSSKSGFHYHLLGRFGASKVARKQVCQKWMELTMSDSNNVAQIDDFAEAHFGYCVKKKKAKNICYLISLLGYRSFWGIIQPKNVDFQPTHIVYLLGADLRTFKENLYAQLPDKSKTDGVSRQMKHQFACLNFCKAKMIKTALKGIHLVNINND